MFGVAGSYLCCSSLRVLLLLVSEQLLDPTSTDWYSLVYHGESEHLDVCSRKLTMRPRSVEGQTLSIDQGKPSIGPIVI